MSWLWSPKATIKETVVEPIVKSLKEYKPIAMVIVGIGGCWVAFTIRNAVMLQRRLKSNENYTRDKESGAFAQRLIVSRAERSYHEMLEKLDEIEYITRYEENDIKRKLSMLFKSSDFFAFIVYGSKGVGKTTLLRKTLTDIGFAPPSWWEYIPFTSTAAITKGGGKQHEFKKEDDGEEKKAEQEQFQVLTLFCELELDDVATTEDVYDRISKGLLGDIVWIKPYLHAIYDEHCNEHKHLLLYLHIRSLRNVKAFDALINAVTFIGNKVGVGVLIEISKSWIYPANQSIDILNCEIKPLDDERATQFIQTLSPNKITNIDQILRIVEGRPRVIKHFADDTLNDTIQKAKRLISDAFPTIDESVQKAIYEMAKNEQRIRPKDHTQDWEKMASNNYKILEFHAIQQKYFIDDVVVTQALKELNSKIFN